MIKSVKEIASSSNVLAPVFRFREYVRGQEYFNNGRIIDFVTDHNSLYVPVTDSIPEQTTDTEIRNGFGFGMPTMPTIPTIPTFDGECHGVKAIADSPAEDPNFMLLVSKGSQGEPGPKGNPGKDGKTPSVFARFDGKQMVFYTMEYVDGVPTTKRIAATNDLTGPAWKPEVINDTIVWRKSKDDEAPKSIPLDELRAKEAPVLLRVNSDNTKREDETSGPANYIQWKYEGEDYWNNLISISELMNLTLAGVTIFPVENEETGKVEYHLGHKEVTKATYDSTETGKRIITEVELGEVLFDAGKIPFPEYTYDYDIAWLKSENCERKREIDAIERELPKFVRSVNGNRPDEEGNVEIEIPDAYTKEESDDKYQPKGNYQPAGDYAPAGDYIKKSDLQFEVRVTEGEGRYLWVTMDGGNSWTKVMEATCACQQVEPCVVNSITLPQSDSGEIGELVCLEAQIDSTGPCEGLEITWISDNQNMPVDENGCVTINEAGEAHITAVAGGKQASTTVIGRAPETTLSVSPTSLSFDAEPTASKTITVTTNANTYDVSADCEWITPTKSGNTITVAAGDNSGAARTCTITITAGDKTKTVLVSQAAYEEPTVPCEVTSVTLNKSTISTTEGGYPETLEATVVSTGECEDITWATSDDTVIELHDSENNNIKWIYPVGSGTATVTASLGGKSATCEITVERRYETYTLTINENGGSAEYKVDDSPWYGYEQPIVLVENTSVEIKATKEGFTPTFKDADTNEVIENPFIMTKDTSINIIWSEDTVGVTDISLDEQTLSLTYASCDGDIYGDYEDTLTATIEPNNASNKGVIWTITSGSNVIDISKSNTQSGESITVTAKRTGTAVITAKASGNNSKTKTCNVTVTNATVPAEGVNIRETLTLTVGENETLSASVEPSCATNSSITWSSNNNGVASVNSNGKVTAVSAGEAIITAKITGTNIQDTCTVTVEETSTEYSITVRNETGENNITCEVGFTGGNYEGGSNNLTVGDDTTIVTTVGTGSLTVSPKTTISEGTLILVYGNVANQEYWNITTNHSIPLSNIIEASGNPTTLSIQFIEEVPAVTPVTSVVMNCHEGSIVVGDHITLSATVYPENATDKTITWVQGQNPKGTISGNTFTATSSGIALIHAEAGGVSSNECGITIDPRPVRVEGISIDSCPGTIAQGLTNVTLTATISPSDATNKNVTWSSSDTTVIEVEQDGHLIVKHKAGTATITVTTEDGNFADTCTIVVPSTAIEFALENQTEPGNTIRYTIGDNIDENDWYETWDSLGYGQTTGTTPPLTISPGESLCITSENYPEDIQLYVNGTNKDDTNGFITMTYDQLYAAAGYSNTYTVTFVRQH